MSFTIVATDSGPQKQHASPSCGRAHLKKRLHVLTQPAGRQRKLLNSPNRLCVATGTRARCHLRRTRAPVFRHSRRKLLPRGRIFQGRLGESRKRWDRLRKAPHPVLRCRWPRGAAVAILRGSSANLVAHRVIAGGGVRRGVSVQEVAQGTRVARRSGVICAGDPQREQRGKREAVPIEEPTRDGGVDDGCQRGDDVLQPLLYVQQSTPLRVCCSAIQVTHATYPCIPMQTCAYPCTVNTANSWSRTHVEAPWRRFTCMAHVVTATTSPTAAQSQRLTHTRQYDAVARCRNVASRLGWQLRMTQ